MWYLDIANIAAVARWMADHGATGADVAYMVEKPWKHTEVWDEMTAAKAGQDGGGDFLVVAYTLDAAEVAIFGPEEAARRREAQNG